MAMCRYLIKVGNNNNVKPGNILGSIANEADMDSEYIGSIQIFDDCSTIDLPDEMPNEVLEMLQKTVVCYFFHRLVYGFWRIFCAQLCVSYGLVCSRQL
jgi:hypothetical protein